MDIGKFLQSKLDEKGMSQAELARQSKVPASTISSIISRNNKNVSVDFLIRICRVLECDINEYIESCERDMLSPSPASILSDGEIPDDPGERVKALHERFGNKKAPSELPPRESAFAQLEKLSERDLLLVQKIIDSIIEVREDYPEE